MLSIRRTVSIQIYFYAASCNSLTINFRLIVILCSKYGNSAAIDGRRLCLAIVRIRTYVDPATVYVSLWRSALISTTSKCGSRVIEVKAVRDT